MDNSPSFAEVSGSADWWKTVTLTSFLVVLVWAGTGWLIEKFADNRGTFGDMFGAVNALFAGLAFAGVVGTLKQQREDLRLQREMLRAQLAEQREARREMEEQAKIQAFHALASLNATISQNEVAMKELTMMEQARKSVWKTDLERLRLVRYDLEMHMFERGYFSGTTLINQLERDHQEWRDLESPEARARIEREHAETGTRDE